MDERRDSSAFQAMSDAVLAIAAERSVEAVLQRLVHAARELAGARFAALGVPDGEGAFAQFITSGMSDDLVAAMGPLPRTHGMLGAMVAPEATPLRTSDIRRDPRFRGWWPAAHPQMRSFLGVPIVARGRVIGAFYLTEKQAADAFDAGDQQVIEMLAAHAAIAIENARLYERSRELSILEERNRLARELHDSVTQKLFGVVLAAEAAATLLDRDGAGARDQIARLQDLAQVAMEELRSLIFELRPAAPATEGLATALRKHVEVLRRVHEQDIALRVAGRPRLAPRAEGEVFRIAQEAVHNALRHAGADRIEVTLDARDGALALTVADDGAGFDAAAGRHTGRRVAARGRDARPPGGGPVIRVVIADDHAVVRQGLRTLLDLQQEIEVVAEAADGEAALEAIERLAPDVVLLDVVMPRLDGIAALRAIRERSPATRVLVLTSFGDDDKVFPAVRAGAAGYLLKDVQPHELVAAIRTVHAGDGLLAPPVAARLMERFATGPDGGDGDRAREDPPAGAADPLTPREREVLVQLARGRPNKVIARELGVSERTVKAHVHNILGKLGLTDRTQAAVYAVRRGLLGPED
jgi:DNA-binding NarL/FixJ family response regulator/signal transduction histidine kinase